GYWLAWDNLRLSQYDSAIEKGRWVTENFQGSESACKSRLLIASSFLKKGESDNAIKEYRKALKEYTSDAVLDEALEGIVKICLKYKSDEETTAEFEEIEKEHASLSDNIQLSMADYFCEKENFTRAHEIITALEGSSLSSEKYLFLMGKISFKTDHYGEASRFFENILESFPDSPGIEKAKFYLAQCNLECENWRAAEEMFREFISGYSWSPFLGEANLGLARSLMGLKKFDKAIELFKKTAKSNRGNIIPKALIGIGDCYFKKRDYEKSLPFFLRVTVLYRKFEKELEEAIMKSGLSYEKLGKDEEAIDSYRKLIEKFPESRFADSARKKIGE
ncbi:tetratricopeptide repeat protein, partial [candidate division WOR-3 bacterium]|nr:tetratricopeptide repeat protein [candidate division WOR-3 bacterium]